MKQNSSHQDLPGASVDLLLEAGDIAGAKAELERLVLEGIDSGDPVEATPEFWAQLREGLRREAVTRKNVVDFSHYKDRK